MIGELPSIIGFNNKQINKEFEYLFDVSTNSLKTSLRAPNGSVIAHWGKFVNLSVDYLSVRNLDTSASLNINYEPNHNALPGRFNRTDANDKCHDLISIAGLIQGESLLDVVNKINSSISYIEENAILATKIEFVSDLI